MERENQVLWGDLKNGHFPDPTWKTLYKVGGIALFIEGLAYLIVTVTSPIIGSHLETLRHTSTHLLCTPGQPGSHMPS